MSAQTDLIRLKAQQTKDAMDVIIAQANALDVVAPPSGRPPLDCLPTWAATGAVTGWSYASIPANDPDNASANLSTYDTSCNNSPDGTIVALGNSIVQYNTFSGISGVLNLGYSGETMRRLIYRLNSHAAHRNIMKRAGAVILHTGVVDISYYKDNYPPELGASGNHNSSGMVEYYFRDLASRMGGKWVIMGVLPINETQAQTNTGQSYAGFNAEVTRMNTGIKNALQTYCTASYVFIDPPVAMPALFDANGNLRPEHDTNNDAIHPNTACYTNIINPAIQAALTSLGVS
jgi:hypothetical protein